MNSNESRDATWMVPPPWLFEATLLFHRPIHTENVRLLRNNQFLVIHLIKSLNSLIQARLPSQTNRPLPLETMGSPTNEGKLDHVCYVAYMKGRLEFVADHRIYRISFWNSSIPTSRSQDMELQRQDVNGPRYMWLPEHALNIWLYVPHRVIAGKRYQQHESTK